MSEEVLTGVALMGATSTGKSGIAIELAGVFDGEVVSMDSRQVYRGLDIGTAKVSREDRERVAHHLIDILEPHERHSAGSHAAAAAEAVRDIMSRGKTAFLTGGTGFYFRALFEGLPQADVDERLLEDVRNGLERRGTDDLYDELVSVDPERAEALSRNDRMRIVRALEIHATTGRTATEHGRLHRHRQVWRGPRIVLTMPRERLRRRIADRTHEMMVAGWATEVRALIDAGVRLEDPAMNSLGYRTLAEAILRGEDPAAQTERIITLTRQYAKRQETFFRSVEDAEWVDVTEPGALARIQRKVQDFKSHLT